jgi:two-component system, sensor histidine kinase
LEHPSSNAITDFLLGRTDPLPRTCNARVIAEVLTSLAPLHFPSIVFGCVGAVLMGTFFWGKVSPVRAFCWLALVASFSVWAWRRGQSFGQSDVSTSTARRWLEQVTIGVWVGALVWGCAGVLLYVNGSSLDQVVLAAYLGITAVAGVGRFTGYAFGSSCFAIVTVVPFVVMLMAEGTTFSWAATGFMVLVPILVVNYGRITSRAVVESIARKFENLDLVEQLTLEKSVSENARREADEANRAKSRFLAAASHDLRQPMHALGLFVSAVRRHVSAGEGQHLVDRIQASVEATEMLFNALLDISRLDAGVLTPKIKTFALDPMLERLASEYSAYAQEKGLQLRVRSCSQVVKSDPTLLERVIRNYLANALRYTQRGGVLLGCRKRGDSLRIEVWDRGCGIPQDKLDDVFKEFYQLGNPERDRAKGLGLGLAIVRRIGELLDNPVRALSRVGKGSCFSIEVPLAMRSAQEPAVSENVLLDDSVLIGAFVMVIDDEADVREALQVLLKQWGCHALSADSRMEALAKLRQLDRAPDAILSDHRLREGETGSDVIRAIRSEWGDAPAALITGDTAPDRLQEAAASGYQLLHKPLNANSLKATLCGMLAEKLSIEG